jgi:hypothetical protein
MRSYPVRFHAFRTFGKSFLPVFKLEPIQSSWTSRRGVGTEREQGSRGVTTAPGCEPGSLRELGVSCLLIEKDTPSSPLLAAKR